MDALGYDFRSGFNERYSMLSRRMLRALSENSRMSISELAKFLHVSRITLRGRLARAEKELGLRYTAEFNENALKLAGQHLIVVNFGSKPDLKRLADLLAQSYIPQVAVSCKGGYDMIIYAAAASARDYAHWDKSMQILLSEYGVDWKPSEVVHRQLGYFPLRNELLDTLEIPKEHREMLKILNVNSRAPFREISRQTGVHFNTVAYNFNKLMKTGYVKRFTITMQKPRDITLMSFFAGYKPREGYESSSAAARKAFMSDDSNPLISRYLICAPLIGSYDFFTLGAFDDAKTAYRNDVLYHKRLFAKHGVRLACGTVDRVILGDLPIRSVDTKKEYNTIVWDAHLQKH